MDDRDDRRLSRRIQNLLLVERLKGADPEMVAAVLEYERDINWENEAARSLRFHSDRPCYDTEEMLGFVLREIDAMLHRPPADDAAECEALAESALLSMHPSACLRMLLEGPRSWSKARLRDESSVSSAAKQFRVLLQRCLATSLTELVEQWRKVDARALRAEWEDQVERHRYTLRTGVTAAPEAGLGRMTREDRAKIAGGMYSPPGRT